MAKKRVHITYLGTVHGVGFRFTAERVASSSGLTGWVRNAPNGTVELTAEGEEEDITNFMEKISSAMSRYIRGSNVNWQEYTGEFDSFDIRFY